MFKAFLDADLNLRGEAMMGGINRCANDGGEFRVNQKLAAHNDKDSRLFRVMRRTFIDSVEFASFHSAI